MGELRRNNLFSVDLKIGFDLTQGENGAPSLRIRDFEGNEIDSMLNLKSPRHKSYTICIYLPTYLPRYTLILLPIHNLGNNKTYVT